MESSEFTLRRILDSSRSGVLRDIKYELKEAVDTKTGCGETRTIITHWIEATINGRVMPHKWWIESGYTAEHADRHKEMVMRGRDKACQAFLKYLIEHGVQKLQESVIWEWEKSESIKA